MNLHMVFHLLPEEGFSTRKSHIIIQNLTVHRCSGKNLSLSNKPYLDYQPVLCMWKNERLFKGTKWLHTFYYSVLHTCPSPSNPPPPPPPRFLDLYYSSYFKQFKQLGQHLLFLLIPYPCLHFLFQ